MAIGIQAVFVSIAVVFGGAWTYLTFGLLEDVVSLNLTIVAEQIPGPSDSRPVVLVKVTIKHNGSQYVNMDLSQTPLLIQKISIHDSGAPIAEKTWWPLTYGFHRDFPDKSIRAISQGVQARSVKNLVFLQELDAPGIYFVSFQVPVGETHRSDLRDSGISQKEERARLQKVSERLGGEYTGLSIWQVKSYFIIVDPAQLASRQDH